MTGAVEVAVGEVTRVAAWALRGLGMTFGVADRGAPLVGWAEAVEGSALETLRKTTPLLDGSRPAIWRSQLSEAAWAFDAFGRSLLEIGPVAIDLLTLAARTGHIGRVDVANLVDPVFLSSVARIAARRQVGIFAISNEPHLTLCGIPTATLHAFPGAKGPVFDDGGPPPADAIDRAVAACRDQLSRSPPRRVAISLLSYAPVAIPTATEEGASRFDAERKYALAQSGGMSVERQDLAHLYQLEMRTWAPTSERSRAQALA